MASCCALLLPRSACARRLRRPIDASRIAEFAQKATWKIPTADGGARAALAWLAESEIRRRRPRAQVETLVVQRAGERQRAHLLDLLAATLAAGDPQAASWSSAARSRGSRSRCPTSAWLADDKTAALRARQSAAALRPLAGAGVAVRRGGSNSSATLKPDDVVDPAALLFYQAVVHQRTLERERGSGGDRAAAGKRIADCRKRYVSVARLMQADLEGLKDESLDHIARRMDDIRRRLDLGRAGPKVREVEDGVIASLDKLIEEMEKQQQQAAAAAAAAGGRGSMRPTQPAPDSVPMGGKGPGEVAKKPIGNESGWGDLPPHERQEALQQIGKDFPAHYRDMIEQYFRKLASESDQERRQIRTKLVLMLNLILRAAARGRRPDFEVQTLDGRYRRRRADGPGCPTSGSANRRRPAQLPVGLARRARPPAARRRRRAPQASAVDRIGRRSALAAIEYTAARLARPDQTDQRRRTRNPDAGHSLGAFCARRWGRRKAESAVVRNRREQGVGRSARGAQERRARLPRRRARATSTPSTCKFEVDKEVIPVKRRRSRAWSTSIQPRPNLPEAIGQLTALDGTPAGDAHGDAGRRRAANHDARRSGDRRCRWSRSCGSIFASGKIAYLSDLPVAERFVRAVFRLQGRTAGARASSYQFRRDIGFEQSPLRLDGKTYRKGLALASRTTLVYKLPGKFRVFKATVGHRRQRAANWATCSLEIKGDGKTLWRGDVAASEAPRELERGRRGRASDWRSWSTTATIWTSATGSICAMRE